MKDLIDIQLGMSVFILNKLALLISSFLNHPNLNYIHYFGTKDMIFGTSPPPQAPSEMNPFTLHCMRLLTINCIHTPKGEVATKHMIKQYPPACITQRQRTVTSICNIRL
jgi:hypothetical protein